MVDDLTSTGAGEGAKVATEEITGARLAAWARLYGYNEKGRQLRKLIARGVSAGDPCPLDEPVKMPLWWAKHMRHRVPEKILLAARSAHAPSPPAAMAEAGDGEGRMTNDDVSEEGDDGEEVRIARSLVKRFRDKVRIALDSDSLEDVKLWNRELKDALETLRKAKAEDRAAKNSSGAMISRALVEMQIFEILKLFVSMREQMSRRVVADLRARVPSVSEEIAEALTEAIETERGKEDELFRNLPALKNPGDVFRLAT